MTPRSHVHETIRTSTVSTVSHDPGYTSGYTPTSIVRPWSRARKWLGSTLGCHASGTFACGKGPRSRAIDVDSLCDFGATRCDPCLTF